MAILENILPGRGRVFSCSSSTSVSLLGGVCLFLVLVVGGLVWSYIVVVVALWLCIRSYSLSEQGELVVRRSVVDANVSRFPRCTTHSIVNCHQDVIYSWQQ